jgi:hypothetical protein
MDPLFGQSLYRVSGGSPIQEDLLSDFQAEAMVIEPVSVNA